MTTVIIKVGNGAVEEIIADKKVEVIVLDHDVDYSAGSLKRVEGNCCIQMDVDDIVEVNPDRIDYIKDDLDADADDCDDDEDDEDEEGW